MDRERKKALINAYKEQKTEGGVYAIINRQTGERRVFGAVNLEGAKNLFSFMQRTGNCSILELRREWERYGPGAFTLEVLATLERKEEESAKDFKEEIAALTALWQEQAEADMDR